MRSFGVIVQAGGLRPHGPPCRLARGGPTIPAPLAWLSRYRSFALCVGRGLELLEDLPDAIVLGDGLVEEELELGHAPEAHPLGDLPAEERQGSAERVRGRGGAVPA